MKQLERPGKSLRRLKHLVAKLKKAETFIQLATPRRGSLSCDCSINLSGHNYDKEPLVSAKSIIKTRKGHFVVAAIKGEERERFLVEMKQLRNPKFVRLLEEAEEEYGGSFRHEGALALPCGPHELQKVLEDGR